VIAPTEADRLGEDCRSVDVGKCGCSQSLGESLAEFESDQGVVVDLGEAEALAGIFGGGLPPLGSGRPGWHWPALRPGPRAHIIAVTADRGASGVNGDYLFLAEFGEESLASTLR
jgi:hypothetical protein